MSLRIDLSSMLARAIAPSGRGKIFACGAFDGGSAGSCEAASGLAAGLAGAAFGPPVCASAFGTHAKVNPARTIQRINVSPTLPATLSILVIRPLEFLLPPRHSSASSSPPDNIFVLDLVRARVRFQVPRLTGPNRGFAIPVI